MRLSAIRDILHGIDVETGWLKTPPNQDRVCTNLIQFREILERVHGIGAFKQLTEELINSTLFNTSRDEFQPEEYERIVQAARLLRVGILALRSTLDEALPAPRPESILVKLPDNTDYGWILSDQQAIIKALEQLLVAQTNKGPIKLEGWENGTLWLHLYLRSVLAVGIWVRLFGQPL